MPGRCSRSSEHFVTGRPSFAGAIDDNAAVDALVAALKDTDSHVREQSAWALGAIGDPRASAGLSLALKDLEPRVRRQAAWALGAVAD